MVLALVSPSCNLISCNSASPPPPSSSSSSRERLAKANRSSRFLRCDALCRVPLRGVTPGMFGRKGPSPLPFAGRDLRLRPRSTPERKDRAEPSLEDEAPSKQVSGDGGQDWTTSVLLLGLWAALMYYVFQLAPDQTPSRDMYFLQKLLNLKADDGFRLNQVLVALWYIMGLWPLVYSMMLLPSGRSFQSKVPVWPFLVLSFFGGAYALIPYFVLWKPPPPAFEEEEIGSWPLNFLESKITAAVLTAAGLGLIAYAGLASGDDWKEFYQYFRESKFIHVMSLDFSLLSAFSAFWVYNDMTARKWSDRGSWLLPVALIPFIGPALYLLLRPPLAAIVTSVPSNVVDEE